MTAGTRRGELATWALFGAVGFAVVAPWVGHGWLLLLDWSAGPRATLTGSAYGLDPSQVDAMPARLAIVGLRHLVGPQIAAWLAIWAVFPIGGVGAGHLVGGGRVRRVAAGLLFVVNPLVLDRVRVGHVFVLLGYAALPWATRSFLAARASGRPFRVRSAGWLALLVAVSPHLAWIGTLVLLATLACPRPSWRDARRVALTILAAAAVYAYGLALFLAGVHTQGARRSDLAAFAPEGSGLVGRTASLVALGGFWRGGRSPADLIGPVWVLVAAAVLAVVAVGFRAAWRRPADRPLAATVGLAGVVGLLLAGGASGPIGPLYRLAFDHLPLFGVMRESQKFLLPTALAYAVGFGFGVEALVAGVRSRLRSPARGGSERRWPVPLATGALVLLPVALLPNLFWGVGGEISTSRYPSSWSAAERLMGEGDGAVLFLPWHQYQPFAFTDGRTVATPAAAYFTRPVISGDDPELAAAEPADQADRPARSRYVESLLARRGRIRHLGRLLAPLGVLYVVAVPGTGEDAWLARQVDLRARLVADDLVVYENQTRGTGRVGARVVVPDVDAAIALAETGRLGDAALVVRPGAPAPDPAALDRAAPADGPGGLHRRNAVTYDLAAGERSWVVVPQPTAAGWRLDGGRGEATVSGVLAFRAAPGPAVIGYRPWRFVLAGYLVSALALVLLLVVGLLEHRHERPWRDR